MVIKKEKMLAGMMESVENKKNVCWMMAMPRQRASCLNYDTANPYVSLKIFSKIAKTLDTTGGHLLMDAEKGIE